jgi:glycosyltransferase involved in cell wall biosynthesis
LEYYPNSDPSIATNSLIEWSNSVWVENEKLRDSFEEKNKNIEILHNYIDRESLNLFKGKKDDGKIYIGWFGGVTHIRDVNSILATIKFLMDKYPHLRFVIWGGDNIDISMLPKKKVKRMKLRLDYYDYLRDLPKSRIDIGIAPLVQHVFNQGKSPCKFFEYSIAGACTIATGFKNLPYARVIQDGENGMLYNTDWELLEKLELLINSKELRETLRDNARRYIDRRWCIQDHWKEWEKALDKVMEVN